MTRYSATSAESLSLSFDSSRSAAPPSSSEDSAARPTIRKSGTTQTRRHVVTHIRLRGSGRPVEKLFGSGLEVEPRVLVHLSASDGSDALHKVEDVCRRMAFLGKDGLDDLRCLVLREAALAQEFAAIVICPRDDFLPRRLDAVDERHR